MKIRFQADGDLNEIILKSLRRLEPMIDFQTAHVANIRGLPDPEVLRYAAEQGRVLVSHDLRTMPRHFGEFIQSADSAGVIIAIQEAPIQQIVESLLAIWLTEEAADWTSRIVVLSR